MYPGTSRSNAVTVIFSTVRPGGTKFSTLNLVQHEVQLYPCTASQTRNVEPMVQPGPCACMPGRSFNGRPLLRSCVYTHSNMVAVLNLVYIYMYPRRGWFTN